MLSAAAPLFWPGMRVLPVGAVPPRLVSCISRGGVCAGPTRVCVCVCVCSPCRVTLPGPGLPSLLPRLQKARGPGLGLGTEQGDLAFLFFFFF